MTWESYNYPTKSNQPIFRGGASIPHGLSGRSRTRCLLRPPFASPSELFTCFSCFHPSTRRFAPGEVSFSYSLQSGDVAVPASASMNMSSGQVHSEVASFFDQNEGVTSEYAPVSDQSMFVDEQPSVDLAQFLSRPVLIKTISWAESDSAGLKGTQFYPWQLFFNSTPIKKKLDNYAFLNCSLRVKFVVNASPFYSGSMLFSYFPKVSDSSSGSGTIKTDSQLSEIIPLSQRLHTWIYPATCQGGEILLPFFHHENYVEATSSANLINMGAIVPYIVNILASANGATGQTATIQVYAWAENVHLAGPTIGLAVQSGDEYGTGIISKPASAVARIASSFGSNTYIGPYARATAMAASAIGGIAHIFGFTNVPVVADVMPFKSQPFPHFASPEISTPIEKLTLDPKNELTIDNRVVGLGGEDELALNYLIGRESYLCSFPLNTTDAVDDVKFYSLVTPNLWNADLTASAVFINSIPGHYISNLFKYWRGDVIFRFRVVATPFHKGRIRVSYDPATDITGTVPDYSTVFNEVVDIGSESEFELRVPYMQASPWALCEPGVSTKNFGFNGTTIAHVANQDNGQLVVRVVTPLSAPVATNEISVQVFVRMADNLRFGSPVEPPVATVFTVQSRDVITYESPRQIVVGNKVGGLHPAQHSVNMGEEIVSLRQLLRRTCFLCADKVPDITVGQYCMTRCIFTRSPPFYGYTTSGVHLAKGTIAPATTYAFNFVKVTPYHWLAPMFVGQRGSFIYQANVDTVGFDSLVSDLRMTRSTGSAGASSWIENSASGALAFPSAVAKWYVSTALGGAAGMSKTNQNTQTGMSALLPDYNRYRMRYIYPGQTQGQGVDDSDIDTCRLSFTTKPQYAVKQIGAITVERYFSIGTDFNFMFFLNCPSYCMLASPAAA